MGKGGRLMQIICNPQKNDAAQKSVACYPAITCQTHEHLGGLCYVFRLTDRRCQNTEGIHHLFIAGEAFGLSLCLSRLELLAVTMKRGSEMPSKTWLKAA